MNAEAKIYFDPFDIDQRLADFGLKREPFEIAAAENLTAFNSCSPNHPPTFQVYRNDSAADPPIWAGMAGLRHKQRHKRTVQRRQSAS